MGETIAVLSGKGGTGKTSVCAAVCTALAQDGYRVLTIDCDMGLQNLDISLGMSDIGALSFLDVCQGGYELSQAAVHPSYSSLFFLTAPVYCRAKSVDLKAFRQMLRQAKKEFDYVLLDVPAGIDTGFELAAKFAERVVLVTLADPAAVRDAARAGQRLEQMGKSDVRLVVNRISEEMIRLLKVNVDDVMDQAGLPLIGVVPEDARVTLAAAFQKPILKYKKRGAAAAAFRRIAKRVQGLPVPAEL